MEFTMKKILLAGALLAAFAAAPVAHAAVANYNITTTWFEPDTQPNDSIFTGSFSYDSITHTVSNLSGLLTESMTHIHDGLPMVSLALNYQLVSWYDSTLGGTFAATFKNSNTNTFYNGAQDATDFWSPQAGVDNGGVYFGFPVKASNPGNAYALIFIPDNPLTALTQAQIDKLAYADCVPTAKVGGMNAGGGMMGAVCMTGTSVAGYGAIGTMSGYPVSQSITAAVPEPETYAMMMAGLGLVGFMSRRRRQVA
jgi:hypothetical protein